jgi:hypothetical protein
MAVFRTLQNYSYKFSLYGSTALCRTLVNFSVYYSYTQQVGLLELGISPSQSRYVHIEQHKHRIKASSGIQTHDSSVRVGEGGS